LRLLVSRMYTERVSSRTAQSASSSFSARSSKSNLAFRVWNSKSSFTAATYTLGRGSFMMTRPCLMEISIRSYITWPSTQSR
jgi:hypothetical protein